MSFYDPLDDYGYDEGATLEEESPRERRRRKGGPVGLYNLLSVIFFIGALAAIGATAFVFRSPEPIALVPPQPTATLIPFPFLTPGAEVPAAAVSPTPEPTPTIPPTPEPTPTIPPTATNLPNVGNPTSTPSLFPFTLVNNAITYEANQNEAGCDWSAIAGRVVDVNQDPVEGLPIQVTGPDDFEQLVFSGSSEEFGPGGFEVQLADEPIEAEYRVQLLNTTGQAFSEPIIVRTLNSCERNVAIAVFEQSASYEAP
jgi:hypothetical protein